MELLVNNLQDVVEVPESLEELFKRVIKLTLEEEQESQDVEISLVLVDDAYIRQLNKEYRNIDRPTDVLSFAQRESTEEEPLYPQDLEDNLLGDIVLSLETAVRQAQEYGHSLEREAAYLVVHGCLHLLGYDHQTPEEKKIMREKEEKIMALAGLSR